jgi:hypothetical protein
MSMMKTRPGSVPGAIGADELAGTARTTGLLHLGLAVAGALGFLLVRGQLYVADDPGGTLSNLVEHTSMARLGIVLELFAVFGMVNAVAILVSAAMLASALDVADGRSLAVSGSAAATVQLLYVISGHLWGAGGLFFGLRLIPMGWRVVRSQWQPRLLGQLLMVGGAGYVLSTFVSFVFTNAELVAELPIVPATIGELWIVGYLIIFGVREHARPARESQRAAAT